MTKRNIIIASTVCCMMAVLADPPLIRADSSSQAIRRSDPKSPRRASPPDLVKEYQKRWKQRRQRNQERLTLMGRQAWMLLLRTTEQHCRLVVQELEEADDPIVQGRVGARHGIGYGKRFGDEYRFHWTRPSDSLGAMRGKSREQMPEGYRIVEELVDLLEDKTSKDDEIRKKIDALQQARAKAREASPKAMQELAAVLTTPRQEAIFLIMGSID